MTIEWHHLIGLTLTDFFTDTFYEVEMEADLSRKRQLLDLVIIEKKDGEPPKELPDGLENLSDHNLITFKSHQEALDGWALDELLGHYVNYRKQVSPSFKKLLPVTNFRLYALSTRYPEKLAENVRLEPLKQGVYQVLWGSRRVRIIVLSRIPETERNAVWLMFSANADKVGYGVSRYQWRTDISTVINDLFKKYQKEGIAMPYTVEDYRRQRKEEFLRSLTPDDLSELLENLPAEERLRGVPVEERLRGLPAEERLRGLSKEEIDVCLKILMRERQKDSD